MPRNTKYFPNELKGKFIGGNSWELLDDFIYISPKYGKIVVPKGFTSDGASIPKIFTSIIGGHWAGKHGYAAVIHDWCYNVKLFSRIDCDKVLLQALSHSKVNLIKRRTMYRAVRLGGWKPWGGYKFIPKISKKGITFKWSKKF